MDKKPKTANYQILLIVSFFMLFGLTFGFCQASSFATQNINYSELENQIKNNNIRSIAIWNNGRIEGGFINAVQQKIRFRSGIHPSLVADLKNKLDSTSVIIDYPPDSSSGWIGMLFSWLPMLLIVGLWIFFMRRAQGGTGGMMSFGKSKARLAPAGQKITFADVAGQEESKEELQEIIEFLKEPKKFQKLGGRIPKGVLLMGPPGVGKTLLARAVAGEASVPFFSISGSEFVEMFVGVGASRVRNLFEQSKKNAPCILFIDEIDAVGRHRSAGIMGGGQEEREQTLNQLLAEMDGFESNEGVIIIGATNQPEVLDLALLRPGRFDRRVVLNKPDVKGREETLKIHTRKIPLDDETKTGLLKIARGTAGFSGADLANLANEAALNAARYNRETVTTADFEFAKDKVLMGGERKSMVISEEEKMTTAVHEAGHALVALFVAKADPLHKVTIIPRGMAMGLTQQLPEEDQHNYSKEYLTCQLAILMGGRCAEKIILEQLTTGASNDIKRTTELARRMVCEWGMSDLGPQKFIAEEDGLLGRFMAEKSHGYSELTAQGIDNEVAKLINKAEKQAEEILTARIEILNRLVSALKKREVLNGDEVRQIAGLEL